MSDFKPFQALDCKHHWIIDDGTYSKCDKHNFRCIYDSYDVFLRICKECKANNGVIDREKYIKGKY